MPEPTLTCKGLLHKLFYTPMEFEVTPYDGAAMMAPPMAAPSESFDYDIEPDDIHVEDTVTVIWEIS